MKYFVHECDKIINMKIFVATHKPIEVVLPYKYYIPLHVGATIHEYSLPYVTDDTGDNISILNPYFCELTGHYWIWKNINDDIVGLEHYRRFFVTYLGYLVKLISGKNCCFLSERQIRKDLKSHDIIISTKGRSRGMGNLVNAYAGSHERKDIIETLLIIHELYPEYDAAVKEVFSDVAFYPANMLICQKNLFDDYCSWLFSILFELEKRIDISNYNDYQKRVFGFIAERIFRVYVVHNKLKTKERHIINTEDKSIINIARKEFVRYVNIRRGNRR